MPSDTQAIEYSGDLTSSYLVAYMIRRLPLEDMLAAIEQCNTLGPILDPTAWTARVGKMREDEAVLRILAAAKRELGTIMRPDPVRDAIAALAHVGAAARQPRRTFVAATATWRRHAINVEEIARRLLETEAKETNRLDRLIDEGYLSDLRRHSDDSWTFDGYDPAPSARAAIDITLAARSQEDDE